MSIPTTVEMDAGDALDELVAEKVMGLKVVPLKDAPCPSCGLEMRFCGTRSRCLNCNEWRYSSAKDYSTDIAAAWEVVLEMTRIGVPFKIDDRAACGQWLADFGGITAIGGHEQRHNAPLAICSAALLACAKQAEVTS